MNAAYMAALNASLNASLTAFDESPFGRFSVANAVGMEATEQARKAAAKAELNAKHGKHTELKKPYLLGCYVNGKLRFQSRDHDAIHEYARKHMEGASNFGNDVWVAPVGSFVA